MPIPPGVCRYPLSFISVLALGAGVLLPFQAVQAAEVVTAASSPTLAIVGTVSLNDPRNVGITSDDTVFVTSFTDGTTSVIPSGSTAISATIATGTNSQGIAVGSDDLVYVTNTGAGTASVIDPTTATVARTISGLGSPIGIALSSDDTVFVIDSGGERLLRVPPGASSVDDSVSVGGDARSSIAVTSDDSVYVGDVQGDSVRIVDGSSMTVNANVGGVDFPESAATAGTPSDDTVYFGGFWRSEIIAFPPGADDTIVYPSVSTKNNGLQVVGPRLYVASDDTLAIFDREPWSLETSVTVCGYANGVAVNSSGVVYVACTLDDEVVVAAEVTASLGTSTGDVGETGSLTLTIPDGLIADDSTIQSISFDGTPVSGWTRAGNTWSGPIPEGGGTVAVTVALNGGLTATVGNFSYPCELPAAPSQSGGIYQLSTPAHLMWLKDDSNLWDDSFVLMNDIDMGSCVWDSPIAPSYPGNLTYFTGNFDGDGHTIDNLSVVVNTKSVDDSAVRHAAFIGYIDKGGQLLNTTFSNAFITMDDTNDFDDSVYNSKSAKAGVAVALVDNRYGPGAGVRGVTVENSTVRVTVADARLASSGRRFAVAGAVAGEVWSETSADLVSRNNVVQAFNYQSTRVRETAAGGVIGTIDGNLTDLQSIDDSVTGVGAYVAVGAAVGELWGGTVSDVSVTRPDILGITTREVHAGGALGTRYGIGASDIEVTGGSVRSQDLGSTSNWSQVGGAIGETDNGYALNIQVTGTTVSAEGQGFVNAGGVIGISYDDTLMQLSSDATVSSRSSGDDSSYVGAGGLIGYYWGSTTDSILSSSFATGGVTAWSDDTWAWVWAGGLVGYADRGKILNSYATGNAQATATWTDSRAEAGGLVGAGDDDIIDSYSSGTPSASGVLDDTVGGLVGTMYSGTVSRSYWNVTTSGVSVSDGGTGLTTDQMENPESFTGWSIVDGWQSQTFTGSPPRPDSPFWGQCTTNAGSPFLLWQYSTSPCAVPPDPSPPRPITPGVPRDVSVSARDRSAVVTWLPPTSSGSYRVSTYEVVMNDRAQVCLVAATTDDTQSCVVENLMNGEEYTFKVRALSGAGWGAYSEPSDPIVPGVEQTIVITGSREGKRVLVEGVTTGLAGEQVTPWIRFPGPHSYEAGTGVRTVGEDGTFTWQRQTRKKIYVYFRAADDVRSNRVIIRP